MSVRIEHDTFGEIEVPADKYWGAQTERSKRNFPVGKERMPIEVVYGFAQLKRGAALANHELGKLSDAKKDAITYACDRILNKELDEHFPLVVWQTGSGTQSNMNVNEVVSYVANEYLKEQGSDESIHPNDDVNKSQSSNDTFPTAMHVALYNEIEKKLEPALKILRNTFKEKEEKFNDVIKIGRTHLQDATPIRLGQEISGWRYMLDKCETLLNESKAHILNLAIGGTAVGTGINAHPDFGDKVAKFISKNTGYPFVSSENKFHALTAHDEVVQLHGSLKALATDLMKIANDVRWLASGPRAGLAEISIPENEPGSSIMPGKVNPTQCEMLTMVAVQVMGNDTAVGIGSSQGNFELNVYKPVILHNTLQSIYLLADGMQTFNDNCAIGIEPIEANIDNYLNQSLMLVTALNPHIGYEKAASIAKKAHREGLTLKESAIQSGYLTEAQFDEWIKPEDMVEPK
ncbi:MULTISPECIES: class II fumarate hydratase [Staphylococcus]|jgi:fumarate hydratase class II|uniref:Fumarate hydratase class II n=1 Tax=Staphylococcus nepalensis TaxID=214473 RepID=A0A291JJM1_9STAP|nr:MULTISPECIES: class II fumarate hydratase [Staphylococcus]VDG66718.1 class II fumarate hydratase [Lacrimispora indolis]ATH59755.1 fumarate hydratase, class II [Staphylococcus nepalensis]ATH64847.1 fumarate hydratase, class II [Staphylococcus nepalensis]AWI44215.1 fumarate hydratase, class II [Staphylococcus nepalensis]MBO1205316.1 class II fumarate hydratase [Staphylococcus nepalensis]